MKKYKKQQRIKPVICKSSNLLLDVMREEYSKERDRCSSLEKKAEFFITAIIAIITLFIPMLPFDKLIESYKGVLFRVVLETVMLCAFTYALGCLIYALYLLFQVVKLKKYSRPNLVALKDEDIQIQKEEITANGLLDHFYTIVDSNIKVNNEKVEKIDEALKVCLIGFVLLAFSTIGLLIIL